jgi:hypothetical protein
MVQIATRLELATALFAYLEIFQNRQRPHASLGMLTPINFEIRQAATSTERDVSLSPPRDSGHPKASSIPGAVQHRLERVGCQVDVERPGSLPADHVAGERIGDETA